jgi:hypothetical protein
MTTKAKATRAPRHAVGDPCIDCGAPSVRMYGGAPVCAEHFKTNFAEDTASVRERLEGFFAKVGRP